jgi:iron complex outermembrane receptor protein
MPSARLAWRPARETLLWAAVSRAVRTPSRIDRELAALPILAPAPDFESEELLAYEAGYRGQLSANFAVSVSLYYNEYERIRTLGTAAGGGPPFSLQNGRDGHTYGVEAWGKFAASDWWRIDFGLSTLEKRLKLKPGFVDLTTQQHVGNDPEIQGQLRNIVTFTPEIEAMVALRYVDDLPNPAVPDYTEMDARVAWRPTEDLEFSISGHNLLHKSHPELGAFPARREIPRTIYGTVRWAY